MPTPKSILKQGRKICEMENVKKVALKSHVKPAKKSDMMKTLKLFIVPEEAKPFYDSLSLCSNSSRDAKVIDFFDDERFV